MKKESITVYANNQTEADKLRKEFKQNGHANKYKLNIIILGNEDPVYILSHFLLARTK